MCSASQAKYEPELLEPARGGRTYITITKVHIGANKRIFCFIPDSRTNGSRRAESVAGLSPLGLGFARAAANTLFKDFAEKGGTKPISECKDVVYPDLLDLMRIVRSEEEDSRVKDKVMQGLQQELSKAKSLIAALAESQGPLAALKI